MFPTRFFCAGLFPPRYFERPGAPVPPTPPPVPPSGGGGGGGTVAGYRAAWKHTWKRGKTPVDHSKTDPRPPWFEEPEKQPEPQKMYDKQRQEIELLLLLEAFS